MSAPARFSVLRRAVPAALAFVWLSAVVVFFAARVNADGLRPKANLTPGETRRVTLADVCRNPRAEVVTVNIPEDVRRRVFREYGIRRDSGNFEVDYLITPDLGGAFSIRNLWPQPYSPQWNAHVKDMLEQRLHDLVCQGRIDLPTAQREIAADWIGAYKKYFHTDRPPEQ